MKQPNFICGMLNHIKHVLHQKSDIVEWKTLFQFPFFADPSRQMPKSIKAPARIETERLLLRKPVISDAPIIFKRYSSDPEVTKYLGWPRHLSIKSTIAFLNFSDAEWNRWPAGPYIIESRTGGRLIGATGILFESKECASTGYVLAKDEWGKGYATEALIAIKEIAKKLQIRRLYAVCYIKNAASCRVLEKCGFHREALLRKHSAFPNLDPEKLFDVYRYGLMLNNP